LVVGAFGFKFLANGDSEAPPNLIAEPAGLPLESVSHQKSGISTNPAGPTNSPDAVVEKLESKPKIPLMYRQAIGPVRRTYSFGESYILFETEPVDEAWAYGMEAGISDYLSRLGPDSGAVFEFVQCRSTACAIAGYVVEGGRDQTAMMVDRMRHEPWWDAGGTSKSIGGEEQFVILLSRSLTFDWED